MADILIVEDDLDLTETYTDWLESRGHSVICASHIQAAIAIITERQPDIIMLDLNLPGNSSSAVNSFIHTAKLLKRAKLIIISGHPEIMSGQGWVDQVDLVLTKPVENQHLLTMIDRLSSLQEHHLSIEHRKIVEKILIVEDDADLVETYTDLLETHYYSVTSTPKAIDAIKIVTRIKPSIVLLDLNLAGHSGTVVIDLIRGYEPLKNTKIVVITGHPELLTHTREASRVDLVLSKPVSNEQLLETIRNLSQTTHP